MISLDDGKILVKFARYVIETYFSGKTINFSEADKFTDKRGVFVTLSLYGTLRGCIGYPEPVYSLNRAIVEAARAAAFKDSRFPPITENELEEITIEVSVLTKPKLIEVEHPKEYLDKIKIGKHGLIVKSGYHSGLLLPQVFIDYTSTPKEALEMTCQKASLDKDVWKDKDTEIYSFSAQIFKETEPKRDILGEK